MEKHKHNLHRGGGEIEGFGVLFIFVLIVAGVLWIFGFNYHGTSEGIVKYDDCREIIQLEPTNWHTYFGTFTGYTKKSASGKIMGGEFVRVINDRSFFFGNSHTCARAYIYEKKSEACADSTKNGIPYPYLGYDDMCYTIPQ